MRDILVVDDDVDIAEMVSEALELEDIPCRTVSDGQAALAAIAAERPALILLDMNMPVMDGVQFCRALESSLGRDGSAIVVMTASRDAPGFRDRCGADDVLGKPFSLDDLYAVVQRHLR